MTPEHQADRHTVLIVEGDEDTADSTAVLLYAWGFRPLIARDGRSALDLLAECRPAAILLELRLPGLDGYSLARQVRAMPGYDSLPLIAITGLAQPLDRFLSAEAGIDLHLIKPVDPPDLRVALGRCRSGAVRE
jgi:DNA-binding response OmpR family regulator